MSNKQELTLIKKRLTQVEKILSTLMHQIGGSCKEIINHKDSKNVERQRNSSSL